MKQWEYLTVTQKQEPYGTFGRNPSWEAADLNDYGVQGWELVGIVPLARGTISAGSGGTTEVQFFFKRPLPDIPDIKL